MDRQISEYMLGYADRARQGSWRRWSVPGQQGALGLWIAAPPRTDWERGRLDALLDALN